MIKRHKIIYLWALFILIIVFGANQVRAQKTTRASTTEDIAIAYYKAGDVVPNFERWIKETAPYINTPWALREKLYEQETVRLQQAYQNFNPKKNHLIVKTFSSIKLKKDKEEKETYSFQARFSNAPEALYFPYDFLEDRIALMPYSLEKLMNNTITDQQYQYMNPLVRSSKKITTIIRMQPYEADFSKPYLIDGLDQWVFKTKIISIEFWTNDNQLIWEYTVPWYDSPNSINIKNLYNERPKNSKFHKGAVKSTTGIK